MSTDPVGLGASRTAIDSIKEGWCNIEIVKEMYCSYSGECPIHRVIQGEKICLWCKHRVGVDMPIVIKEKLKDG